MFSGSPILYQNEEIFRKERKRRSSNEPDGPQCSRTLKQYSAAEKLGIIDYAKIHGNRAAGREYNVAESSIREWRKNETKLLNSRNCVLGLSLCQSNNNNDVKRNEMIQGKQAALLQLDFCVPNFLPPPPSSSPFPYGYCETSNGWSSTSSATFGSSVSSQSQMAETQRLGSARRKLAVPQKVIQEP